MVGAAGEAFELDVFSATPGCSRCRRLVCAPTRTTDDLLLCLLETFLFFGGVPEGAATDNMGAPVVLRDGKGAGPGRAWRFVKEAGVDLRPRAPSSPQAKGKDESTNRFANRLRAYDGDLDGLAGLLGAVAHIESRRDSGACELTGMPPAALLAREEEYLRPLGNEGLLRSMVGDASVQAVPSTMLVRAAGRHWPAPRRRVGARATVAAMPGGQAVVKVGGEVVAWTLMAELALLAHTRGTAPAALVYAAGCLAGHISEGIAGVLSVFGLVELLDPLADRG